MGLPGLTQFSSAYENFVYSEDFSLFLSLFFNAILLSTNNRLTVLETPMT